MPDGFHNLLLSRLTAVERRILDPYLVRRVLPKGEVLQRPGDQAAHLYFVEAGVVYLVVYLDAGERVAVAATGSEGVAGAFGMFVGPALPRVHLIVEIEGSALALDGAWFRDHTASLPRLTAMIERYVQLLVSQVIQSAVCNRYHPAVSRLARWLLLTADCAGTRELPLTHGTVAEIVGGARSLVSTAIVELREAKAITSRRGTIIINRPQLHRHACECYDVVAHATEVFTAS